MLGPPHPCPAAVRDMGVGSQGPCHSKEGRVLFLDWGETLDGYRRVWMGLQPLSCYCPEHSFCCAAEQDINLIKQCLDIHIFRAEHDINLIKQ